MTEGKEIAAVALWETLKFSTLEIARLIGEHESKVVRAIDKNREELRFKKVA
jgi:IS30 family transposase